MGSLSSEGRGGTPSMEDQDYAQYDNYEEYDEKPCSVCVVPGPAPVLEIRGVENGSEKSFKISQYHGRYLVIVFYHACAELVEEFSNIKSQLASNGAEVVCVSSDTSRLGGSLSVPLWSDPTGELATAFDLYNQEENRCLDGVAIIDDAGITRHVMATSLETKEVATSVFSMVPVFKKTKVDLKEAQAGTRPSVQQESPFKVKIDVKDLEKDWDVTEDPELRKVLNVAKLLGRTAPPKENNVKKVTGVAYMPEELTGQFTSLRSLSQREQSRLLSSEVFKLTYDDWMAEPGAKTWSEGQGVFVNNYNNFLLWVNLEDQLRLVSASKGQDLKYVLLRLQKGVARIEEALKSC